MQIETIKDSRAVRKTVEYLVKWKGIKEPIWTDFQSLHSFLPALEKYEEEMDDEEIPSGRSGSSSEEDNRERQRRKKKHRNHSSSDEDRREKKKKKKKKDKRSSSPRNEDRRPPSPTRNDDRRPPSPKRKERKQEKKSSGGAQHARKSMQDNPEKKDRREVKDEPQKMAIKPPKVEPEQEECKVITPLNQDFRKKMAPVQSLPRVQKNQTQTSQSFARKSQTPNPPAPPPTPEQTQQSAKQQRQIQIQPEPQPQRIHHINSQLSSSCQITPHPKSESQNNHPDIMCITGVIKIEAGMITFEAITTDGKIIHMNNKELKEKAPMLLISYYEKQIVLDQI